MGTMAAKVGARADLYAFMGSLEASWLDQKTLSVNGAMGSIKGTYEPPQVILHGWTNDLVVVLSPPNAVIDGFLTDVSLTSNRACSERQLALGAAVIAIALADQR